MLDARDRARREELRGSRPRRAGGRYGSRSSRPPSATSRRGSRRRARSSCGVNENTSFTTRFMCRTTGTRPRSRCGSSAGRCRRGGAARSAPGAIARPRSVSRRCARANRRRRWRALTPRRVASVVLGVGVERAVGDEAQRAAHELGRVDPTRFRFAVGAALQAGPEPVGLGGGGERVRDGCCGATAGRRTPRGSRCRS